MGAADAEAETLLEALALPLTENVALPEASALAVTRPVKQLDGDIVVLLHADGVNEALAEAERELEAEREAQLDAVYDALEDAYAEKEALGDCSALEERRDEEEVDADTQHDGLPLFEREPL